MRGSADPMEHQSAEQHDHHNHDAIAVRRSSEAILSNNDIGVGYRCSLGSGTSHKQREARHLLRTEGVTHECLGEQHHVIPGQYFCRVVTHGWQAPFDGLQWPDSEMFSVAALRPQGRP